MIRAADIRPPLWLRLDDVPKLCTDVQTEWPGGDVLALTIDGERRLRRVHDNQPVAVCEAPEWPDD